MMRTNPTEAPPAPPTVAPGTPAVAPPAHPAPEMPPAVTVSETEEISLLPQNTAAQFRSRWDMIQSGFVDDPRRAVQQAGELVEEALKQLTTIFGEKHKHLQRGETVETEELRQTLRHYRLLLNHLF